MKSSLYLWTFVIGFALGPSAWSSDHSIKPMGNSSAEEELWPDWGQSTDNNTTDDQSFSEDGSNDGSSNGWAGTKSFVDSKGSDSSFNSESKIHFQLVRKGEERPKGSRRPPKVVR